MNQLLIQIKDFIHRLPPPARAGLARVSVRQSFKKSDYLLRTGEVCRYSYQIETRLARKYSVVDGRELTTEFYFPDDLALYMTSYTLQTPSKEAIQVLAPTTAWRTDYLAFADQKARFPIGCI